MLLTALAEHIGGLVRLGTAPTRRILIRQDELRETGLGGLTMFVQQGEKATTMVAKMIGLSSLGTDSYEHYGMKPHPQGTEHVLDGGLRLERVNQTRHDPLPAAADAELPGSRTNSVTSHGTG